MTNQETLKRAKAMDIDFGEGQTLRGLLEDMEREIKRKDDIIVMDNRHINKLDKENEANKKRIAVLERALANAISGNTELDTICEGDTGFCNDCLVCYYDTYIQQAESKIKKEQRE